MAGITGRLFCLTSSESEPSSDWFPSLTMIATNCLMSQLSETVSRQLPGTHSKLWKSEPWQKVKAYLHDLPFKILDDIYDQILSTDQESNLFRNSCQNCSRLASMLKCDWKMVLSDPDLSFLVFWLFFDEQQTKMIKNQNISSPELMDYLSTVKTCLTSARGDYFLWIDSSAHHSFQVGLDSVTSNLGEIVIMAVKYKFYI
jgi:hypothetical protein